MAETQTDAERRRVLIAEDEALIRLDLREMLIEEGYDVVGEAGDGETALRLAEQLRPDLVILDIKMPIMDGLTAAENIAGSRLAPVVILTAFSQRDLVERLCDSFGAPGGIRTHTVCSLSASSLPVGLQGPSMIRP